MQTGLAHIQRSRLCFWPPVYCRMLYTWHMRHYILCLFSSRPKSTPPFLPEQPYLSDICTYFITTQTEASPVRAPSPLRTTFGRPIPTHLPLALHSESRFLTQPTLLLPNPPCLSLLFTLHSLSFFSSADTAYHLRYSLSLSVLARLVQLGHR